MSEDKVVRLLRQDLLLLIVGALCFQSAFMLQLGGVEFILLLLGLALMLFSGTDTLWRCNGDKP